jgi:hypothetical protein
VFEQSPLDLLIVLVAVVDGICQRVGLRPA